MKRSRRQFSGTDKVAVLRRHLIDSLPVSDICSEYELRPTVFYRWQKQFFENGAAAFDTTSAAVQCECRSMETALRTELSVRHGRHRTVRPMPDTDALHRAEMMLTTRR